jgi:hypothetical protein
MLLMMYFLMIAQALLNHRANACSYSVERSTYCEPGDQMSLWKEIAQNFARSMFVKIYK